MAEEGRGEFVTIKNDLLCGVELCTSDSLWTKLPWRLVKSVIILIMRVVNKGI